ncbi:glutathione peroxidase [Paenibacillus sacheonensis]|uniref:Glutathione peroxidase n=1 Tax=Paenibacillus sacheonensis TaxID=742054 RepID=A0A7X5C086_9BACL|nr:glutathione peroxidase [Paenibacillus sacheonensis]MBM7563278.1 glutathione peroxidase [Paenibacillus sacheonensis]NBC68164.1 redoxin domain-containing protein [Paenibacillus sacheonensis]
MSIYDFKVTTIDGKEQTLAPYEGKILLIVNTASACGLTPHYKGLQQIYDQFKDEGVVVLGFPCDQFKGQEPGTNEEIAQFCELNYSVTFPMFAKIDVKGENADPLYKYLVDAVPAPYHTGDIDWNFAKFLVDCKGNVVKQYPAPTDPAAIEPDLRSLIETGSLGAASNTVND